MDLLWGIPSYCGSSDISSSAKIISSKKITSSWETNKANYHIEYLTIKYYLCQG